MSKAISLLKEIEKLDKERARLMDELYTEQCSCDHDHIKINPSQFNDFLICLKCGHTKRQD